MDINRGGISCMSEMPTPPSMPTSRHGLPDKTYTSIPLTACMPILDSSIRVAHHVTPQLPQQACPGTGGAGTEKEAAALPDVTLHTVPALSNIAVIPEVIETIVACQLRWRALNALRSVAGKAQIDKLTRLRQRLAELAMPQDGRVGDFLERGVALGRRGRVEPAGRTQLRRRHHRASTIVVVITKVFVRSRGDCPLGPAPGDLSCTIFDDNFL